MFETFQWYDWIRVFTVTASFISMYILTRSLVYHGQSDAPQAVFSFFLAIIALLFLPFVGGIEAISSDRPANGTLFVSCLASLFAINAVSRPTLWEMLTRAIVTSRKDV